MLGPPRTIGATDSRPPQFRCLIAACAVVVAGCASGETDNTGHDRCEDITVETYCAEPDGCRSLEEQERVSEDLCDRGLDSFAHVFVTGCGFTELRTVGPLSSEPRWFDTRSGALVGFTWLSDTEPECNGTFVGSERPADCESVTIPECTAPYAVGTLVSGLPARMRSVPAHGDFLARTFGNALKRPAARVRNAPTQRCVQGFPFRTPSPPWRHSMRF